MHKNKKRLKHRLKRLRIIMYTIISLVIIETSGIFSLAKNGILYVYSNAVTNAFAPATYVDITINEPNGNIYYITDGNKILTEDGESKEAEISNPGSATTKKPVLVRARIIAVIHDQDDIALGITQEFKLTKNPEWTDKDEGGYYYYQKVLNPGDENIQIFSDVSFTDTSKIPENGYVAIHVIVDAIEVDTSGTNAAKEINKKKIMNNWKALPDNLWTEYFPT